VSADAPAAIEQVPRPLTQLERIQELDAQLGQSRPGDDVLEDDVTIFGEGSFESFQVVI
jgi:hypothetical protein